MRSLLVLALMASVGQADIYFAGFGGIWKTEVAKGIPTWTKITDETDTVIVAGSETPKPPEPPQPPNETLEDRVARWAVEVNESVIAASLGRTYKQFADALRPNDDYDQALRGIKTFNDFVLAGSKKSNEWRAVLIKVDGEIANAPRTSATLAAIGKGFSRASEASKEEGGLQEFNAGKLLKCLPCIIDAFLSPPDDPVSAVPIPDPAISTPPGYIGTLRERRELKQRAGR